MPHILYTVSAMCLFFLAQIRKNRYDSYKKRRPTCFFKYFNCGDFGGLAEADNNPVPDSQVGLQQFRDI